MRRRLHLSNVAIIFTNADSKSALHKYVPVKRIRNRLKHSKICVEKLNTLQKSEVSFRFLLRSTWHILGLP